MEGPKSVAVDGQASETLDGKDRGVAAKATSRRSFLVSIGRAGALAASMAALPSLARNVKTMNASASPSGTDSGGSILSGYRNIEGIRFANEFPSLRQAIDDLPSQGGLVFLPPGVYDLGGTGLTVNLNNVTLMGAGRDATRILYSGSGSAITFGDGTSDVLFPVVRDLRINGTQLSQTGIRLNRCKMWGIERVHIYGFSSSTVPGVGLLLDGQGAFTGNGSAHGLSASNCFTGIQLINTCNANSFFGCVMTGSQAKPPGSTGVDIASGNGNVISGCNLENWERAIRLAWGDNMVIGNRFENDNIGILIEAGKGHGILGNVYRSLVTTPISDVSGAQNVILDASQISLGPNVTFEGRGSVAVMEKPGPLADSDFLRPVGGIVAIDTVNNRLVVRKDDGTYWYAPLLAQG